MTRSHLATSLLLPALAAAAATPALALTFAGHAARPAGAGHLAILPLLPPAVGARLVPGSPPRLRPGGPQMYPIVPTVFGSDFGANNIQAHRQAGGALLAVLVDPAPNSCGFPALAAPAGLWVDAGKNLWSADNGSDDIRMFRPGAIASALTLPDVDGGTGVVYQPVGVSYDSYHSKNLYVGNRQGAGGQPGNIEVWTPGALGCGHKSSYPLSDKQFMHVFFVANDRAGNLYVDFQDWNVQGHVCFIPAAVATAGPNFAVCSPGSGFVSTVVLGHPGGLQASRPGPNYLGVVDQAGLAPSILGINVYHPLPLAAAPGPPAVPCSGINPGFADPVTFANGNGNGTIMWASDATIVPGGEILMIKNNLGPCPPAGPGAVALLIGGFAQLFGTATSPANAP
jgi:hypothetical protein